MRGHATGIGHIATCWRIRRRVRHGGWRRCSSRSPRAVVLAGAATLAASFVSLAQPTLTGAVAAALPSFDMIRVLTVGTLLVGAAVGSSALTMGVNPAGQLVGQQAGVPVPRRVRRHRRARPRREAHPAPNRGSRRPMRHRLGEDGRRLQRQGPGATRPAIPTIWKLCARSRRSTTSPGPEPS